MILLTISLIVTIIILILIWLTHHQYSFWKKCKIVYVNPQFPFGNLKGVGSEEHIMNRLHTFYNKYKNKTPIVGIYFFLKPIALAMDQDLLKHIFIKDAHNFNDRGIYYNEKDDPLSAHLFTIHGPKWRALRSKLTPTFTSGKMKFMFPTIVEVLQRLELKIEMETEFNTDIEIKDILARYTTDVIGSCAFGIECHTLNNQNAEFRNMGMKIFENPKYNFVQMLILMTFRDFATKIGIVPLHKDMTKFFTNVVVETMKYRKTNKVRRNDFLDLLIDIKKNTENSENPLTLNEILAQAFVFFAAGFETSSTLLTFCLYELAVHQNIQQNARNHIDEVLKKHDGQLTYEAMMDMKYLDQILNETLRLYSPVTTLFRTAENDYKIPNSMYVIKKGTLVAIPVYAIHRDTEFYKNPEEFNPDNFTEANIQSRPTTSFLPFGEGPRNCIGARFGMMQARLGLIATLRKFTYSLSSKMEFPVKLNKNRFITSPVEGMWLKVKRL